MAILLTVIYNLFLLLIFYIILGQLGANLFGAPIEFILHCKEALVTLFILYFIGVVGSLVIFDKFGVKDESEKDFWF